jgi:hypothetical protein
MGLIHSITPVYSRKTDKRWSTEQSAFPVFAAVQKNMFCTKKLLRQKYKGAQISNTALIKLRKCSLVYCILKYFSTDFLWKKIAADFCSIKFLGMHA